MGGADQRAGSGGISVGRISVTPVKCFRLGHPGAVDLGLDGVRGNRLFFLVGAGGERLRSSETAWPVVVSAVYDPETDLLEMRFPDGSVLSGGGAPSGEELTTKVGGREQVVRLVPGPWDGRLSELGGRAVRLARVERDGAAMVEPVTILSSASVARLAHEAGLETRRRAAVPATVRARGVPGARGGPLGGAPADGGGGGGRGRASR